MRCQRCAGRKSLWKVNNVYCKVDSGGVKVDCPLCLGSGKYVDVAKKLEETKPKPSVYKEAVKVEEPKDNVKESEVEQDLAVRKVKRKVKRDT